MPDLTMGPFQIASNVYISGYGRPLEMAPGATHQFTAALEVEERTDTWVHCPEERQDVLEGYRVRERTSRIVLPAEITIDATIEWSIRAFPPARDGHDLGLLNDPDVYGSIDSNGLYTAPSVIQAPVVMVYSISPLFWGTFYLPGWLAGDRNWKWGDLCYCNVLVSFGNYLRGL